MNLSLPNALKETSYTEETKKFITELLNNKFQNDELYLYQDNEEGSKKFILIKSKFQLEIIF